MIDASNGKSEMRKMPTDNRQKKDQLLLEESERRSNFIGSSLFSRSVAPVLNFYGYVSLYSCKNSHTRSEINSINYTNTYLTQYFICEESDSNTFEPLTQKYLIWMHICRLNWIKLDKIYYLIRMHYFRSRSCKLNWRPKRQISFGALRCQKLQSGQQSI